MYVAVSTVGRRPPPDTITGTVGDHSEHVDPLHARTEYL
jgi:hypothetical protein